MGFAVISKCSIEFPEGTPNTIFDKVTELLKANDDFYHIENHPHQIYFEISGYKGIDYDGVKEIQKEALELLEKFPHTKEGFIINCSEYTEALDGYYFEFDKKKECTNCQGRGWYMGDDHVGSYGEQTCEVCNGKGQVE